MRKSIVFCLFCLLFLLSACGSDTYRVITPDNVSLTVDTVAKTIRHGDDVYTYEISGQNLTITYPNGGQYFSTKHSTGSSGGWNETYDPERYLDGSTLCYALEAERDRQNDNSNPFLPIILIVLGAFQLARPQVAWFLSRGFWFKNAEPSDGALTLLRIGGGVLVGAGVVLFFI